MLLPRLNSRTAYDCSGIFVFEIELVGDIPPEKSIRMSIPKSEEDVDKLVQEVRSEESKHVHEHGEFAEEREAPTDIASLLASVIRMLSHFDGHLSELATSTKSLVIVSCKTLSAYWES